MGEADYVRFLCDQGYSNKNLQLVACDNSTCTAASNGTVYDLNYLSFSVSSVSGSSVTVVFNRSVMNMGSPSSTYKAVVAAPPGLIILAQPSELSFTYVDQTQEFVVTVDVMIGSGVVSGCLVWDDGTYQVRSPIVAHAI